MVDDDVFDEREELGCKKEVKGVPVYWGDMRDEWVFEV